jgi:uncharacterized protein YjbI with pentapeptide repeats
MTDQQHEWRPPGLRDLNDPVYQALMDGDVATFNRLLEPLDFVDLSHSNLVASDLRGIQDIRKLKLTGARLRQADLRGLDLSQNNLDGVTINGARVSGTRFPSELTAEEIRLALEHGIRIRHCRS